jgi:transcriptional regulator with XRE-family HTH domain
MLVRKLRLQKGWSQEQLAEFTGLSVRTIQRAERGFPQSLETRKAFAAVFGVDYPLTEPEDATMPDENDKIKSEEGYAIEYVQGLKAFYQHLLLFLFILLFFVGGIYLVHGVVPTYIQFLTAGWVMGLLFHGLNAYEVINLFGPAWERKKIEKRLGRKL